MVSFILLPLLPPHKKLDVPVGKEVIWSTGPFYAWIWT